MPRMPPCDAQQPELMFRPQWWRSDLATLARSTVVCGCGGGEAVRDSAAGAAVALPAPAAGCRCAERAGRRRSTCSAALQARAARGQVTVLTPHPLEAARLLGS